MSVAEPKNKEERREQARLGARSLARDLLRLVRALKLKGVDLATLEEDERDALDQCNQDLADALASAEEIAAVEARIAETRALLHATRASILGSLDRSDRAEVLRAMLAVEVTEEDLAVESVPLQGAADLAKARRRAEARLAERTRGEKRRRRAESAVLVLDAPLSEQLTAVPVEWLFAADAPRAANRPPGATIAPEKVAEHILDPQRLAGLVAALHPRDHRALAAILGAGGVMPARDLERNFGDSSEDGFTWVIHPPTSVVGRLRARGLCFVGRAALGANPRSRPRVVVIPPDLRPVLAAVLAAATPAVPADPTVPADVVETVMADAGGDPEGEGVRFDRFQPDLAGFAAAAAETLDDSPGAAAVIYYVERVWAAYEAAHPGLVPRLRPEEIDRARRESDRELAALAVMHERLLRRRVATLLGSQPHLYTYLAAALEDLPIPEEDRAIVFHACDTTIRALDRSFV
jgi:hypothetical protein